MKNILITFPNAIDPTTGGLEKVYHNLTPFCVTMDIMYMLYIE